MVNEIWKDIEGYEGFYQVSNKGNIKSLPRYRIGKNKSKVLVKGKLLKFHKNSCGYLLCGLSIDCKQTLFLVHRIVAKAFIPNPSNLPCINHKDENKENNCVNNLEWCTQAYNKLYNDNAKHGGEHLKKEVIQLTTDGIVVNRFKSIKEAIETTHVLHISDACSGKLYTSGGYVWRYE